MTEDKKFEKKELDEEELDKVDGGVQIVTKESEDNDFERDFNRLKKICDRRNTDIFENMNLLQKLVDNNSEIKNT